MDVSGPSSSGLTHRLDDIAAHSARYKTLVGYRTDVTRHLMPGLGAHRIEKLEPEHIEKLYGRMIRSGFATGTVPHAHRTLRALFNNAVKRKPRNLSTTMLSKDSGIMRQLIELRFPDAPVARSARPNGKNSSHKFRQRPRGGNT